MREVIRENIFESYSLHDMCISAFEIAGDDLILRTQSGLVKTAPPCTQPSGYVKFYDVKWNFSYVYLLEFPGNVGKFSGEKFYLKDFIVDRPTPYISVMDETYGYNSTKYTGYITVDGQFHECMLEIYHEGDMVFVDESEYIGMKKVILSHDGEAMLCSVPAEVVDNLDAYCFDFAVNWVWHGPENGKYLSPIHENQIGAMFGAEDFIDYLNRWAFPQLHSVVIKGLGCDYDAIPEAYRGYPHHNF